MLTDFSWPTFISCVFCVIFCSFFMFRSWKSLKNGVVDNGAEIVVSIGVLMTFGGIAYSLWNFNTSPGRIETEINQFIDGMKTAFWTSIIGMFLGMVIKLMQSGVEQSRDTETMASLSALQSMRDGIARLEERNEMQTQAIVAALGHVKDSIEAGGVERLSNALTAVSDKMEAFISSVEASKGDMTRLAESTDAQARELRSALTGSIEALCKRIDDSGTAQAQQLTTMNDSIGRMIESAAQSAAASSSLLDDTRDYQQKSLANDNSLAGILTQNTNTIDGMRTAFDDFLKNMADNYNRELINALKQSMEQLNTQLQAHFGENFQELNDAVKEVAVWQRDYKDVVEKTTEELKEINEAFNKFHQSVVGEVDAHITAMTASLEKFTDTSEKNVGVQENLADTTRKLGEMIAASQESVEALKKTSENFAELSSKTTESINAAFIAQGKTISGNISQMSDDLQTQMRNEVAMIGKQVKEVSGTLKTFNDKALSVVTDTSHYLREFRTTSADVTTAVRQVLDNFHTDFSNKTKESLKNLQAVFKQIEANTKGQQENAVKTLAASMGAISTKIISDYNALISRIAELDVLLKNTRDGGVKQ